MIITPVNDAFHGLSIMYVWNPECIKWLLKSQLRYFNTIASSLEAVLGDNLNPRALLMLRK